MTLFVHRARVLQISLFAILSAFVVELIFGLWSNSLGLITDSMHALLDSIVTIVLILAVKMAAKPPDAEHTYGHGKIESLGGLFGGIAILFVAGFFIYEAASRLQSPEPQIIGMFGIVGGIYTVGVDIFRIVLLRKSIKKIGGIALKADFYHAFVDLGSTILAIGGIALVSFGFFAGDFIAALVLGGLLVILSLKLIYKTAMDLTDVIAPQMVNRARASIKRTPGVTDVKSVLMRRSGEVIFTDATISLRADVSVEQAHEISTDVQDNIKREIPQAAVTVHFEPNWSSVPKESKIKEIAVKTRGVRDVHNINLYTSESKSFVDLHVMVERNMSLSEAHKIADDIEVRVAHELSDVYHVTVHLEPHVMIPEAFHVDGQNTEQKIQEILKKYPQIRDITRIRSLDFENILKIEIDCSFDGNMTIEEVHDIASQIEQEIKSHFKNAIITIHSEPI